MELEDILRCTKKGRIGEGGRGELKWKEGGVEKKMRLLVFFKDKRASW